MAESNDRTYAEHLAAASPLAGAALLFGDLVEDVDARRDAIPVHRFATTLDAKAAADRDEIADGDVVVVEPEGVVGFLIIAYSCALTEERGALPYLTKPGRDYMNGQYVNSVVVAEREARALGFLLRDEDAQDRIRSMRHLANTSAERLRTDPDPQNPEWEAALARLTVALDYLSQNDPMTAEAISAGAAEAADRLNGTRGPTA